MPRRDGTGPMGMGPMTGWGTGFCTGAGKPGFRNPALAHGMGLGLGRGFRRAAWLAGLVPGCGYLAYRWANHRARH